MRILKLSALNILRSKHKTIIYTLIMCILMSFYYLSWQASDKLNLYMKEYIEGDKSTNIIYLKFVDENIDNDKLKNEIKDIDNIESIKYDSKENEAKVYIKNYLDIKKTSSDLENKIQKKYTGSMVSYNDSKLATIKTINTLNNILKIMFYVVIIIIILCIMVIINQLINENINELVIYKSMGYTNFNLFKLLFYECSIIISLSTVISMILSNTAMWGFIKICKRYLSLDLSIVSFINISSACIMIASVYAICLVSVMLLINKIKKLSIKSLIDSE